MAGLLQWTLAALFIAFVPLALAEPIDICVMEGEKIADKFSCTRYHVCRKDEHDEFTTDIAICTSSKVFDMVTSSCVDVKSGYLQDPAGCTTYYGCHRAKKNSEGYIRRHFVCPGELRFHPTEKYCTFKTQVPDKLCNSRMPSQQILGEDISGDSSTTESTTTTTSTASTTTSSTTTAATTDSTASDTTVLPGSDAPPTRGANSPAASPIRGETDIDRITQVIKGQLLNRRPIINNQVSLDPTSRE